MAGSSSTPRATIRRRIESRSRTAQFTEETFQRHHLRLDTPLSGRRENSFEGPPREPVVGEEHTIVGPYVQAPFESPEDVHSLDRRVIRRSQVVHGERGQCDLHDKRACCGSREPSSECAVCALRWPRRSRISTSGRVRVPTNSLPRVKRRTKRAPRSVCGRPGRPRQHPARSQGAPTSVPGRRRWRGQLAVGPSKEETRRLRATCSRSGRVAPGCASSAEAPRRPGATTFLRWGNPTHVAEPCEPPAS